MPDDEFVVCDHAVELHKLRGAFEVAAASRETWKRRALEAGWGSPDDDGPPPHRPDRGSDVAAWIKSKRDAHGDIDSIEAANGDARARWEVLDDLLEDYRLHADTGVPLDSDEPMGPMDDSEERHYPVFSTYGQARQVLNGLPEAGVADDA